MFENFLGNSCFIEGNVVPPEGSHGVSPQQGKILQFSRLIWQSGGTVRE